jgi:hypothetical protein
MNQADDSVSLVLHARGVTYKYIYYNLLQYIDKSFFTASGVGLSPLYYGHFWPIVSAPDDR